MAEILLVTGMIGSDRHAVTCGLLEVTGSAPVVGWVESLTGGVYDAEETAAQVGEFVRLFAPGYTVLAYADETTAAPLPVIEAVSPRSMVAEGDDVELHVTGTGFVPRSQIVFNGGLETTVFVSPTELTTIVVGLTATTPGEYPVQVQTAEPGGGLSGTRLFAILAPEEDV